MSLSTMQQISHNSSTTSLESPGLFSPNESYISSSATSVHDEEGCLPDLAPKIASALASGSNHTLDLLASLDSMVRTEGGGTWPPRPTYRDSWPQCLHLYDHVARQAPPRFVTPELRPNYTDTELQARIDNNRSWLAETLSSVDVAQVMAVLPELSVRARLGFLACMAYLVHLYRWGTLPVVAVAQDEKRLSFPATLHSPFEWLNNFYGIESSGGCLFSMTLVNIIDTDSPADTCEMAYSNMRHMPYQSVRDAERYNALVFYEMERLSLTLYRSIAQSQPLIAMGRDAEAAAALRQGNVALKSAFRHFFETLKEDKIQKDVWMSHAQGFHGWGVDDFDGVSGDHSLLIRTLDAFLDIPLKTQPKCPFATARIIEPRPAKMRSEGSPLRAGFVSSLYRLFSPSANSAAFGKLPEPSRSAPASVSCVGKMRVREVQFSEVPYSNEYLPRGQVQWIRSVREARLRHSVSSDSLVAAEMAEMLKTFKLWRMGHTRKAVYYEDLNLPERKPMTASGGVGGGVAQEEEGLAQMIEKLELRLKARISATK